MLAAELTSLQQQIADATRLWGYGSDPINRRPVLWRGKTVLDIGMGGGPHAIPFLLNGAAGYIGVDPLIGTDQVRDKRSNTDPSIPSFHAFPFTVADIMEAFPNCRLYSSKMEDVPLDEIEGRAEFVILNGVTEHLEDLGSVFGAAHRVTAKNCVIWISHANYYGWPGHHRAPQTLGQLKELDGDPNGVIDWKHLDPSHPIYHQHNLNRVRLDDFRAVVDGYFEIKEWRIQVCALERLTPALRERWKRYTLEELLAGMVFVCGVRRDEPVPTAPRPLHHPPHEYLADADYSGEVIGPLKRSNLAYFHDRGRLLPATYNGMAAGRIMAGLAPGEEILLKKFPREIRGIVESVHRPKGWDGVAWVRLREPVTDEVLRDDSLDWEIV
jgi:SAM-dependent methyltransferase